MGKLIKVIFFEDFTQKISPLEKEMSIHSLINAIKVGDLEKVKLLISEGKSAGINILNEKDNWGSSPFHMASCNGHLEVV